MLQEASTSGEGFHVQAYAMRAIHQGTEDYATELFSLANLCYIHANHVTMKPSDIQLVLRIWREWTDWDS